MNPRRRITWVVFAACAALLALGLAWVSASVVRLENRELAARVDNQRREAERLALWRMDSLMAPLIAQEAARPYFQYRGFVPAGRSYESAWQPAPDGAPMSASPLLTEDGQGTEGVRRFVTLHFQIDPDGEVSSPEAPTDDEIARAGVPALDYARVDESSVRLDRLAGLLRAGDRRELDAVMSFGAVLDDIIATDAFSPLPGEESGAALSDSRSVTEFNVRSQIADIARNKLDAVQQSSDPKAASGRFAELMESADTAPAGEQVIAPAPSAEPSTAADGFAQSAGRERYGFDAARENEADILAFDDETSLLSSIASERRVAPERVRVGSFDAVWAGTPAEPELLLVRDVVVDGAGYRQGVWLDWDAVRAELLAAQVDLFPTSRLFPIMDGGPPEDPADASRRLATIPVRYEPGGAVALPARAMTPARWSLVVTWIAVIAAIVAIGVVLRASINLSDRRGRFVSAVTHELRTPLTTFRLYSGMLADGMVTDEDVRAEYLDTLKRESGRLSGIVENVLEYARLGRRVAGKPGKVGPVRPEDLLVRMRPVLSRRAEQGGMDLIVSSTIDPADARVVYADAQSVERIMSNLVENACRYAAPAEDEGDDDAPGADTRIHLDASAGAGELELLVADYGPGVPASERGRIFGEFRRGGRGARADRSGLGLGLALSRALAREADGDLRLVRRRGHGAEFLLTLPLHDPPAG